MKKLLLTILIAVTMLACPIAVFAEGETTPAPVQTGWNETRTVYYDEHGNPTTGLFKAKMSNEVGALFYADANGQVKKTDGIVTVDGSKKRYLMQTDKEGHKGFVEVPLTDTNTYTYFTSAASEGAVVEVPGMRECAEGKFYIQDNCTVLTTAGLANCGGAIYFVQDGGLIRTKAGFFDFNGKRYLIGKAGTVYTKPGLVKWGGKKYVVQSDASICTKKGPVKAGENIYFVKDKSGVIVKNKAVKYNNKKYHVQSNGVVAVGVHKWDGKFYYSGPKGNLKTKTAMVTYNNKRFLAKKGGLVVVNKKFKYKNKYYIARKNGAIYVGLFKWGGTLYYSDSKGALLTKATMVKIGDYSYYVQAGGKVYVNQKFKAGGKTYVANANGQLQKGLVLLNGNYYYADADYTVRTSQEIISYQGKYYFNNKGGGLTKNNWVNYNNRHYYAGSDAAFKTSRFTISGVTFSPNSKGEISDEEYKKLFPDPSADEGDNAEDAD